MQGIDSGLVRIEDEQGGDRTVMVYATEQQAKAAFDLKSRAATPGIFELQGCCILAALSDTAETSATASDRAKAED